MPTLLHTLFHNSALKHPSNVAIVEESGQSIDYSSLHRAAKQFANVLIEQKPTVSSRPLIGVLSHVHIQSVAAILGSLMAGYAYVPLDESSPKNRLLKITRYAKINILLVDPQLYSAHQEFILETDAKVVWISHPLEDQLPSDNKYISYNEIIAASSLSVSCPSLLTDDLAYILHSSGSTGTPKGIMLSHRNACTFVDWMQKEFVLDQNDVVLSRAPLKFDLSIFDIFNTLAAGASLVCFDWHAPRQNKHEAYVNLLERSQATILYTTPSTLISLFNRGNLRGDRFSLRQIMYAGEPFATPLLRRLMLNLPGVQIANLYGPTETNVITCQHIKEIPKDDSPIPIGRAIENTEILVVSSDASRPCQPEEVGELWCRGGSVTQGYLGDPQLTHDHQALSPIHDYPIQFWRTGDYGYKDSNGILHYKGRRDDMVKVKGFRIELGEIESNLAKDERLDQFCIVVVADEKYGNRLVCFYSLLASNRCQDVRSKDIELHLAQHLPAYMLPFAYVCLQQLPLNTAGKIDRFYLANLAATMIVESPESLHASPSSRSYDFSLIRSSYINSSQPYSPAKLQEKEIVHPK